LEAGMGNIKTAISIDSETYAQVEKLTKRLHISRSQFFTEAARTMVGKDRNLDLLKRINTAYENDNDEVIQKKHQKRYAHKKVVEKW
jgi:metal-responsive CopG/Arc/MetJ family transcriptional regulator